MYFFLSIMDFTEEQNTHYWYEKGKSDIIRSLEKAKPIIKKAKNVILFIGDGMSLTTLTSEFNA